MRLLVVRLSALGDVAILEPVLRQRAAANPDVLFMVAGPPRLESLFGGMENVQYVPTERKQRVYDLFRKFCELKPDKVADMHHVLRTIGVDWLFRMHGVGVKSIRKHTRLDLPSWQRYDQVFGRCGLKGGVSNAGYWRVKPASERRRVVGVAPFAQHRGKIWPIERMEELVGMLSAKGYSVWAFGSGSEAAVMERWAVKYNGVESLAGKFTFEEELQRIRQLDVMVSMDSANMHFASCLGIPVVSIWGATHPCRGFYGWRQDPAWAVQQALDCRPCSKYGNKPCKKGDYPCLTAIEPREVMERIEGLFG